MWGRGGANIGTVKSRNQEVGRVVLSAFGSRLVGGSNPARSACRGCRILPGLPERGFGGKHIFLAGVLDAAKMRSSGFARLLGQVAPLRLSCQWRRVKRSGFRSPPPQVYLSIY